jgi:hypothetical protein
VIGTATRIGSVAGVAKTRIGWGAGVSATTTRTGSVAGVAGIATRTLAGVEASIILIDVPRGGTATMTTVTRATAIIITGAGTRMTTTVSPGALNEHLKLTI